MDQSWQAVSARVDDAVSAIRAGRFAVVLDDADREGEGDLIMAAELVTPERMTYLLRHTSGIACVPASADLLDRAGVLPMTVAANDRHHTAFGVTVDAAAGVGTGISATDRTRTVRLFGSADLSPAAFVRPGHVFPLRAHPDGVLGRRGHTEAGVDLMTMAGLRPAGLLAELTEDDGKVSTRAQVIELAVRDGWPVVTVEDLVQVRRRTTALVQRCAEATLPTAYGPFRAISYRSTITGAEHLALVHGSIDGPGPVSTRLHSECLTGDIFGSARCDCGEQLDAAMRRIVAVGKGVVVYLRGHEGRGIGLADKIAAYALQQDGLDTVEANLALGHAADLRDFAEGVQILADLQVTSVRLMTNNPDKVRAFDGHPVRVADRIVVPPRATVHNVGYLLAKQRRMGHLTSVETVRAGQFGPRNTVAG